MSVVWVDIIEEIVAQVVADASKPSGMAEGAPFYFHGHLKDINKQLVQRDKGANRLKIFPLICVIQDFEETLGETMMNESEVENMTIIIATNTKAEIDSPTRYDETFRDILYPLYDLLISKIAKYQNFTGVVEGLVPHKKTDRLYWGSQVKAKNVFNSYIDAIEISNLNLIYTSINC